MDSSQRLDAEHAGDRRADAVAVLVIFTTLVLAAVHLISGWTF